MKIITSILKSLLVVSVFFLIVPSIHAQENRPFSFSEYTGLEIENKERAREIIQNLKEELSKLGVPTGHGHQHFLANLDEETKEKAKQILKNAKEGTITHEEAKTQLAEIGVKFPNKKHKQFDNLDEETKTKAKEIFKQVHEGKMTQDEAKTKLQELGITLPKKNEMKNLDQATKQQVASLIEETRLQLEELGYKLPKRFERMLHNVKKENN
nr:hypothetical protein [Lysinibacillus timonensis]